MSKNSSIKQSSSPTSRHLQTLRELTSSLRDKNDILEAEFCEMKADQVSWDFERSRLLREIEVLDEKLKDLTLELGFRKESETNAIKRHARAVEYSTEVEAKMEALQRSVEEERGEFTAKLSVLKDELTEKEVELKEFRKMIKVSEAELGELRGRNEELETELGIFEAVIREKDEENGELKSEKEELLERIRVLKDEKVEIVNYKDGEIEELRKEKEGLEMVIMTIDEKTADMFLKLQVGVITQFRSKANRCAKFRTAQVEKALALIEDALEEEHENGVNVKDEVEIAGNLGADPAFVSHVNVLKCEETVKTTVLSLEEPTGETGAASDLKSHSRVCIEISDSDDDEISRPVSSLKRARASSVYSTKKHGDDTSSDASLNPKRKMKKLGCVLGEVATIRKCNSNKINISEYMEKHQQRLKNNLVVDMADMVLACQKDPEFCTKAVCALFRNGLLQSGQKGFKKRDIDRGIVLAEFLVDGDPNYDKKKSVDELKQRYPDGLDTCKRLVLGYSDKLFDIFKSNKDRLFSQKSAEMQCR